jgi:hypothetical protein
MKTAGLIPPFLFLVVVMVMVVMMVVVMVMMVVGDRSRCRDGSARSNGVISRHIVENLRDALARFLTDSIHSAADTLDNGRNRIFSSRRLRNNRRSENQTSEQAVFLEAHLYLAKACL